MLPWQFIMCVGFFFVVFVENSTYYVTAVKYEFFPGFYSQKGALSLFSVIDECLRAVVGVILV